MINIIINNQIFIPKENILYIDTECVVGHTVAGASVKQCTIFLKGVNGGGCDGINSITPLQIPVAYEHIAILKQAVGDVLRGITANPCLKLNTEMEIIDSVPTKECGNIVNESSKGYETVTCPYCSCEVRASNTDRDFPLLKCFGCSKEFTYYQAIAKEGIEETETKLFVHARSQDQAFTLCGKTIRLLEASESWLYPLSFLDLKEVTHHRTCPQCLLIAEQTV